MYPRYFGLKEPSFSIAPDPHYLFLSEQHREALAHLLYGASESGGFVLLTGEVGTGKTTVCRAFLEQLPADVDVALILNPAQTASELLLTLCDELRIPVAHDSTSIKALVDLLNQYLLEAHAKGRRPVLIIDEAQNLQPQVLEQIRLLTNLETTKHKLLQIFLIGQPELRRLLDSEQLRQLNQRITARFHLTPFDLRETGDYIRHRVAVAGVDRPLFAARAIRRIYRYSGGIPRLINILCDRALLGTCVTRGSQVTPAIVDKAAREVRGESLDAAQRPVARPVFLAAAIFTLALAAGRWSETWQRGDTGNPFESLFSPTAEQPSDSRDRPPPVADATATPAKSAATLATAIALAPADGVAQPSMTLSEFASDALDVTLERLAMSESDALRRLLMRWGHEAAELGSGDPCANLGRFGLRCEQELGTFSNLRYFDLPALLRVASPGGPRRFVVLTALGDSEATLDLAAGQVRVPLAGLERIWTGNYILVWQPPPNGATFISANATGESVRWLRQHLARLPELNLVPDNSPRFDSALAAAVRAFQTSRGLQPDGVAGPRTLIQLTHAVAMPGIPSLGAASAVTGSALETP